MTLTYPVLNRARRVLWVITGEDKRTALARLKAVIAPFPRDGSIPIMPSSWRTGRRHDDRAPRRTALRQQRPACRCWRESMPGMTRRARHRAGTPDEIAVTDPS